jgi:hypothetical protein
MRCADLTYVGCCLHAVVLLLQAGRYQFDVTPPATVNDAAVLGNPLNVTVHAGPASANNSNATVTPPSNPAVGSFVAVHITLRDANENAITAAEAEQHNNSMLVVEDSSAGAWKIPACFPSSGVPQFGGAQQDGGSVQENDQG